MDIWEANLDATAYTPHPCKVNEQTRCEDGTECGAGDARYDGLCDRGKLQQNDNTTSPRHPGANNSPQTAATSTASASATRSSTARRRRSTPPSPSPS